MQNYASLSYIQFTPMITPLTYCNLAISCFLTFTQELTQQIIILSTYQYDISQGHIDNPATHGSAY